MHDKNIYPFTFECNLSWDIIRGKIYIVIDIMIYIGFFKSIILGGNEPRI